MTLPQGPRDSLGISIAGGVGSPHGNVPLFIATMDTNGLAAKTEKLQVRTTFVYVCIIYCMLGRHCLKQGSATFNTERAIWVGFSLMTMSYSILEKNMANIVNTLLLDIDEWLFFLA